MGTVYLIGGVGAGKSTVLDILRDDYSAFVIEADKVARELMEPGKTGYRRIVEALGQQCLLPDGSIDRQKLAAEVFTNRELIGKINAIIHPLTWDRIRFMMSHSDRNLIVMEAAIYDSGHRGWFDEVWYVYADEETRIRRLMASRGYSEEKCRGIIANQKSDEEFRRVADRVIDNSGTIDEARMRIAAILGAKP